MPPKKQIIPNYKVYKYAVIRLENEDDDEERLFECIPDRWFVDETKKTCFWPPTTVKSFTVKAINCEKPDDSWNIYACTVISDGHRMFPSIFLFRQFLNFDFQLHTTSDSKSFKRNASRNITQVALMSKLTPKSTDVNIQCWL